MGRAPSINSIVCTSFISLSGGTLKGSSAGNKAAYRVRIFFNSSFILLSALSRCVAAPTGKPFPLYCFDKQYSIGDPAAFTWAYNAS